MTLVYLVVFILFYLAFTRIKTGASGSNASYILAGRKLTLFPLLATIVASQYGWINGVFEVYFMQGPSAWLVLSLPYLLFNALWIYLGKFLHSKSSLTTPQLLKQGYNETVGKFGASLYIVLLVPIMYIHMGANLIQYAFDIPFMGGAMLMILLSSIAVFRGGFERLVRTDIFLFLAMYAGLIVTLLYLGTESSSPTPLAELPFQPEQHGMLGWWLMALIVFIDPSIHQRIWAVGEERSVKRVMGWSLFCWIVFDLLVIAIVWLAKSAHPEGQDVFAVFNQLPSGLKGFFALTLLSVILSTSNTHFSITLNTIAIDLLNLDFGKSKGRFLFLGGLLMVLCWLVTVFVYQSFSVVDILFNLYPACVSAIFLTFVSIFIPRVQLPSPVVLWTLLLSASLCRSFQV